MVIRELYYNQGKLEFYIKLDYYVSQLGYLQYSQDVTQVKKMLLSILRNVQKKLF